VSLVAASSFSIPARRNLPQENRKRQSDDIFGNGASWVGDIAVGSNQDSFKVILDTGSGTLGIFGSGCQACRIQGATLFNPSQSDSFQLLGCSGAGCICNSKGECFSNAVYGDGSTWSGIVGKDELTFGGWTGKGPFAYMVNASASFVDGTNDGILGLTYAGFGYPDSPIQEILDAREAPNMFWMGLNTDGTGVMTLGNPIADYYTGDMQTIQVYPTQGNSYGWYVVRPQAFLLEGKVIGAASDFSGSLSIVDSGTTFLLLPPTVYSTLKQTFTNSYSKLPCLNQFFTGRVCQLTKAQRLSFPNISFTFDNNVEVMMSAEDYIIVDSSTSGTYGMAIGSIGQIGAGSVGAILGDPFMSGRYMGFDRDNHVVQFARSSGYTEIHNAAAQMGPLVLAVLCAVIASL